MLAAAAALVPPLSAGFRATKGISGCIAVVGGCLEYCGAPYYAAIAGLKMVRGATLLVYHLLRNFKMFFNISVISRQSIRLRKPGSRGPFA